MAHEQALHMVDTIYRQVAQMVTTVDDALAADGKIDAGEVGMITLQGVQLANAVIGALRRSDKAMRDDMKFVVEHGRFVLPE